MLTGALTRTMPKASRAVNPKEEDRECLPVANLLQNHFLGLGVSSLGV